MYGSVREKGNYSVWEMAHLSFSCIFSVLTDAWCICNCNTWAHLVRIWRHSQNSTCQFLFHHQVTWMTDPLSPMWSHIQHMVTITLTATPSLQSTLWLICFGEKGSWLLWSQMALGLLTGPFRAVQKHGSVGLWFRQVGLHMYNVPVVMLSCLSLNQERSVHKPTSNYTFDLYDQ